VDGFKLAITQGENSMITKKRADSGFTLIEILMVLAITAIVLSAIYTAFQSQHKTYITQEAVAEMQQNLRAAMYLMTREIRMAGFDPTGLADAGIGDTSTATVINFTEDIRGDNAGDPSDGVTDDPNENITYSLAGNNLVRASVDGGPQSVVAENISALNFFYLDEDNNPTATASEIRCVQIAIVTRTGRSELGYNNIFEYYNLQGQKIFGPANDGFHRKALSTQVKCRNLGL